MSSSVSRRAVVGAGLAAGVSSILPGFSSVTNAQARPIKVGLTSIFSGRVAQLGITTKNRMLLELEAFNTAGGFGGRPIGLIGRDSKGRPEDAARLTRELIESEGCEVIFCGEASGSAFAAHEVARASKVLLMHAISDTTQLTADPKLRSWNSFRTARQALHDSIVGGAFAAGVAKKNGFTRWATIAADYAYGRDATPEFMAYVQANGAKVELVAEPWPKLFQPDYTDSITKILQAKPQAMSCGPWGGDLVTFIDQGNLFELFDQVQVFAIHLADYTTLTAAKILPTAGAFSSNRYVTTFPARSDNTAWADAYAKRFNSKPTDWSWEACVSARFPARLFGEVSAGHSRSPVCSALLKMRWRLLLCRIEKSYSISLVKSDRGNSHRLSQRRSHRSARRAGYAFPPARSDRRCGHQQGKRRLHGERRGAPRE